MSQLPFLPQDILDQIIDLCGDDSTTLKSLSIVCKDFIPESQKCIFETVDLRTTEDDAKSRRMHRRFYSIISQNRRIAQYVRELLVRDISDQDDPPENERASWIRDEPTFLDTLNILSKAELQRFTLQTDLYWTALRPPLQCALLRLFVAPSLKYLGLSGLVCFPGSHCSIFRRLQELSLVGVEIEADDGEYSLAEPDARSLTWIQLEEIRVTSLQHLISGLYPDANPSAGLALEAIHVGPQNPDEAAFLCTFINAARRSLRSLHWEYSLRIDLPPPFREVPLNLSDFERLNWLTFEVSASETLHDDDYFAGMINLLSTAPQQSEITMLHFTVYFADCEEASTSLQYHNSWDQFRAALEDQRFRGLKQVHLKIDLLREPAGMDVDGDDVNELDVLEDLLLERLKSLDDRGILSVFADTS